MTHTLVLADGSVMVVGNDSDSCVRDDSAGTEGVRPGRQRVGQFGGAGEQASSRNSPPSRWQTGAR